MAPSPTNSDKQPTRVPIFLIVVIVFAIGLGSAFAAVDRLVAPKKKLLALGPSGSKDKEDATLYDRLGGVFAISAVVDYFSDQLVENPLLGKNSPNPALRDWNRNHLDRLAGLKFLRTLWLCAAAGGPYTYQGTIPGATPLGLENAHCRFRFTSGEFDEAAKVLARSLAHFNVPAKEAGEVLAAFAAHKSEVIAGSQPGAKCPFAH